MPIHYYLGGRSPFIPTSTHCTAAIAANTASGSFQHQAKKPPTVHSWNPSVIVIIAQIRPAISQPQLLISMIKSLLMSGTFSDTIVLDKLSSPG